MAIKTETEDIPMKADKNVKKKSGKFSKFKKTMLPDKDGKWYKPATFLWKYPLAKGVWIISIIMMVVMVICIILTVTSAGIVMSKYDITDVIVINAAACTFTELTFSISMLVMHVLLFLSLKWKTFKTKNYVLVSWIAAQAIWLIHKAVLLLMVVLLFIKKLSVGVWIVLLLFSIIAMVILTYFWMIVHSYWRSLKGPNLRPTFNKQGQTPKTFKKPAVQSPNMGQTRKPYRTRSLSPRKKVPKSEIVPNES